MVAFSEKQLLDRLFQSFTTDGSGNLCLRVLSAFTQQPAYTQTYATADKIHAAMTSADLATTTATQTTPWGFASQAQANAIATQLNAARADIIDVKQVVNSLIDDLQALGLVG